MDACVKFANVKSVTWEMFARGRWNAPTRTPCVSRVIAPVRWGERMSNNRLWSPEAYDLTRQYVFLRSVWLARVDTENWALSNGDDNGSMAAKTANYWTGDISMLKLASQFLRMPGHLAGLDIDCQRFCRMEWVSNKYFSQLGARQATDEKRLLPRQDVGLGAPQAIIRRHPTL